MLWLPLMPVATNERILDDRGRDVHFSKVHAWMDLEREPRLKDIHTICSLRARKRSKEVTNATEDALTVTSSNQ